MKIIKPDITSAIKKYKFKKQCNNSVSVNVIAIYMKKIKTIFVISKQLY